MDPDSLIRWKLEYENQRKDQFNKIKDMQKETLLRKK